jgi:2-dehydro-3-deoxyglucarate aldolase
MKNKKIRLGSWITIGHPAIAEIMASSNFDWLCIDMEHSTIDLDQMTNIIRALDNKNCFAYIRVGKNSELEIKKVLDAGAKGIIIPQINSKEDAKKAVDFSHYPPLGKRGVGLSRAQGYGKDFTNYLSEIKKELEIIAIIENKKGIENLDEILRVKGITGSMIGPYDLSASYNKPGNFTDNEIKSALQNYEKIAKRHNKPFGFHAVNQDNKKILSKVKKGYSFIAIDYDANFLLRSSSEKLEKLKKQIKS